MCGPFALPLALMAAGTVSKYFGEQQAQRARNSTFSAERQRQQAFTEDQTARFKDSLAKTQEMQGADAVKKAVDTREASLAHAIVPGANTTGAYLPGSSSAPGVVATAQDKADASSQAGSQGLAHALATLGGTGDQLQQLNTNIGRNSEQIGQIGSFKAGSMGVLDAEMRAAAQKGAFLRGVGGLAQTIGSAWMGAGGAGGGAAIGAGNVPGWVTEAGNTPLAIPRAPMI